MTGIVCESCGKGFTWGGDGSDSPFLSVIECETSCPHCENKTMVDTRRLVDYKIGSAAKIKVEMVNTIDTDELVELRKAFESNMFRIKALAMMPDLAMRAWVVRMDIKGDNELADKMRRAMVEMRDDLFSEIMSEGDGMALEQVLTSMVVQAWTAFETLAGDLWETALNVNPRWGGLHGKKSVENRKEAKKVSLDTMAKITQGTYDLGKKMGTLHRDRFKFTALGSIREAYDAAFDTKKTGGILDPLKDKSLDSLSAVRNLIVHKAGVADQRYVGDAKSAMNAPKLKLGERLRLNGEVVAVLINPVIRRSDELLKSVDDEIVADL